MQVGPEDARGWLNEELEAVKRQCPPVTCEKEELAAEIERLTKELSGRRQQVIDEREENQRLRALTEWQPIETAPWECVPVLLWRNGEYFTAARLRGEHGPGWCTPDGYQIFNPTHWKPLGPGPEGKQT